MEAIDELCYKNKNFKDLINDKPFKRTDIVTVQSKLHTHPLKLRPGVSNSRNDPGV